MARFKNRRRTAAQWATNNEVILEGEIALTIDAVTKRTTEMRIGDGTTPFLSLPPFTTGGGGGGSGATAFADLTDKSSVDLVAVNTPLATALAAKASASATTTALAAKADAAATTTALAAKADASALAAKADASALASKADVSSIAGKQDVLSSGTNIKTINGASVLGSGNLSTNPAAVDITAVSTLTYAAHANKHLYITGSTPTLRALPSTGMSDGDVIYVKNTGGAVQSFSGAAGATAGRKNSLAAGEDGGFEYLGGVWTSSIVDLSAAAPVLASISGTGSNGSVLTCTPASGYVGTFQWRKNGVDISGATSQTYTISGAVTGDTFTCRFANLYISNTITIADTQAPSATGAPHVDSGTPTIVRQSYDEAIVANGIVAADVTVTGHTVSSVAISGTELQVTVTPAFVNGEASRALSVAANKLKDAAGNLCGAITSAAITNNVPPSGITDNFNRADGALTTPWVQISNYVGNLPVIVTNRVRCPGNYQDGVAVRDCTSPSGTMSVDVPTYVNGSLYLIFRADVSNGSHAFFRYDTSTGKADAGFYSGGNYTVNGAGGTPAAVTTSSPGGSTMSVVLTSTSAVCKIGSTTIMTLDLTGYGNNSNTNHGFRLGSSSTANIEIDNFSFA